MAEDIRGITYINKKAYEYQVFPEQYFSGADIKIYFGDTWADDITGIEFTLFEKVVPIFGYASRTWDFVCRGQRFVRGTFRIAFREAGYLFSIIKHLGMLDAEARKPELAFMMADQATPEWVGKCNDRIEDILARYHLGVNPRQTSEPTGGFFQPQGVRIRSTLPPETLSMGSTGEWVEKLQQKLTLDYAEYCLGPEPRFDQCPELDYGLENDDWVAMVQSRLSDWGIYEGPITGNFGPMTRDAVTEFQRRTGLEQVGRVGPQTKELLSQGFEVTGYYGPLTTLIIYRVQRYWGIAQDGITGPETASKIWPEAASTTQPGAGDQQPRATMPAPSTGEPFDSRAAELEKSVWARDLTPSIDQGRKHGTYFYGDKYGRNLLQTGFNMYFIYGPLSHIAEIQGRLGQKVNFKTTVHGLRNIQLEALGQIIDASGNPVEEVYQFIAQDID